MNILQLSTADKMGGAALAAYRLHTGLQNLGHHSTMFVAQRSSHDPTVLAFEPPRVPMTLSHRLRRRLRLQIEHLFPHQMGVLPQLKDYQATRPPGYDYFSGKWGWDDSILINQLPQHDLINLHWVAEFVDYRTFLPAVAQHTPLVWTLHDMNPFTGGCHYNDGCLRYNLQCGACPQLGSQEEKDLSHYIWNAKRDTFAQIKPDRLHFVSPSRWLARSIENSTLLRHFPVTVIPYGLDTVAFAPREKAVAREVLGIPPQAHVVLFVAQSVNNHRKGFSLLVEALARINNITDLHLVSIGMSKANSIEKQVPYIHIDYVRDPRLLSLIYSAADLFVIPSLEDNLPNTVLESMACGTPVVGFDVGGIPDMVRQGETGLLVPVGDVAALHATIIELLQNVTLRAEMAANCRRIACAEYSLDVQARSYIELYKTLVGKG